MAQTLHFRLQGGWGYRRGFVQVCMYAAHRCGVPSEKVTSQTKVIRRPKHCPLPDPCPYPLSPFFLGPSQLLPLDSDQRSSIIDHLQPSSPSFLPSFLPPYLSATLRQVTKSTLCFMSELQLPTTLRPLYPINIRPKSQKALRPLVFPEVLPGNDRLQRANGGNHCSGSTRQPHERFNAADRRRM